MCDFIEINDLNNQIMNHKELGSCTEINQFGVKKKPQMLALCKQLVIHPGTLKNWRQWEITATVENVAKEILAALKEYFFFLSPEKS